MRKVADWQIAHPNTGHEHDDVSWTHAVLYAGMADWAELSEKEDGYDFYYRWLLRIGSRNQYQLGSWMYHADFIAVAQVYLDLYNKYGQERMIWHTLARTDWVIGHPAKGEFGSWTIAVSRAWTVGHGVTPCSWPLRCMPSFMR